MAEHIYDPDYVEQYYDADPQAEWERLVASPTGEVQFHIHDHYLRKYIQPGSRVLEIGAGPGRFSQVLDQLGCAIVVSDISTGQLAANKAKATEHGFAKSIEGWIKADISAMPQFAADSFDAVVAYGGPLSYVFERADDAAKECFRVLKDNGVFLLSVMSLWGTMHRFLKSVFEMPNENNQAIVRSGDLTPATEPGNQHRCHMFRADELRVLLGRANFQLRDLSASSSLSINHEETLAAIREDPESWRTLLAFELEASASSGNVEAGTHMIAAATKSKGPKDA